jgi:hypothetical protein
MQAEVRGIASQAGKVAEMAKRIDRMAWKAKEAADNYTVIMGSIRALSRRLDTIEQRLSGLEDKVGQDIRVLANILGGKGGGA